ncbi:tRNA preQ1(34) S-adenosylmethionine ribosyltransferase-isomerase QueA [Pelagibius litoralis]|uniref:S-adenosylmethionine:tRNA ribosyltransferase-isomerase n=1 Tax=Pelagibius litoralis TaxID=374515 RepID=A0A967EZ72_9PROT|nr:tRNA preQ1(34) S-adenosylmethionine ribosyltransferase-isomerase QueA [Pelagibius litoralis]NIA70118.1 tRNA preQ1(34) S-adenosylmethionine ribosyltransferase-isomerase QueA [Pelagibius litoralis]
MRTEDFDFDLPRDLIAQHPVEPREAAGLLHVGAELADRRIADLPGLLRPGDLLVTNDTKVIPARLSGKRGTAGVEVTLHKAVNGLTWKAFARPARKLAAGDRIDFAEGFCALVEEKGEAGEVTLVFDTTGGDLLAALDRHGVMPLPPYITRERTGDPKDRHDYQTVFAEQTGAVAAPTAGLHFTEALLAKLSAAGIERVAVTLHVGAGTFLPVKTDDVGAHKMHSEACDISAAAAAKINAARAAGGRIVAVGTTALRLLETAADDDGQVHSFTGETDLFILPGHRFKAVDLLMTNFHLPRSTLFMLVCAFAGKARMEQAYAHAIAQNYRFYSYGDACLLEPEDAR